MTRRCTVCNVLCYTNLKQLDGFITIRYGTRFTHLALLLGHLERHLDGDLLTLLLRHLLGLLEAVLLGDWMALLLRDVLRNLLAEKCPVCSHRCLAFNAVKSD